MTELPPSRTLLSTTLHVWCEVEDSARDRLLRGRRGEDPPVREDVQVRIERQPQVGARDGRPVVGRGIEDLRCGDDAGVRRTGCQTVRAVAGAGHDEHTPVGKPGESRIPPGVRHWLDVAPRVRRWIEDRGVLEADVGVDVTPDDKDATIRERRVPGTEQVRGLVVRNVGECPSDRIPDARVGPAVGRAVENQKLAVGQHARMDWHDRQRSGSRPLAHLRRVGATVRDGDAHRSRGRLAACGIARNRGQHMRAIAARVVFHPVVYGAVMSSTPSGAPSNMN